MSNQERMLAGLADVVGCCSPLAREPLSPVQTVELSRVFKAMGDPVRLRLLSLIASHEGGEACVCDLTGVGCSTLNWPHRSSRFWPRLGSGVVRV